MFRFPWGIPKIEKFPNQFPFDWTTKVWIAILEARPVRMGRKGCCDVWGAIGFPAKAWLHEVHASWSILLGRVAQTTNEHGGPSRIAAADHTFTRRSRGILSGNQTYLLRSQRSTHGRVHICVKSLGFTLLGSVQFEATQTFQSLKPFKSWEGLPGCNPSDVDPASALMKRLKEGKVVYAVTLASPQRAATTVEWCSPVAWSKFLGNPSWGISQQKPGCVYIYVVCVPSKDHILILVHPQEET